MEDDKKDILKPQDININFKPEDIQMPKRFQPIEGTSIKAKIINKINRLNDMIYHLFEGMESIPRKVWKHIIGKCVVIIWLLLFIGMIVIVPLNEKYVHLNMLNKYFESNQISLSSVILSLIFYIPIIIIFIWIVTWLLMALWGIILVPIIRLILYGIKKPLDTRK